MRRLFLLGVALACLGIAGPTAWAKLSLAAGLPDMAALLAAEPSLRGVALYQAGRFSEADAAFAEAGRTDTYNRGLSLAATGEYALSRAYFDAVLFANPADSEARDNRNTVDALIDPVIGEGDGAGSIAVRVIASPDEPLEEPPMENPRLSAGRRVADAEWLMSLPDDPGEFLRLRLADEYVRRMSLGLSRADEVTPW